MNLFFLLIEDESEEQGKEPQVEVEQEIDEEEVEKAKPKKVPNQFNFCERATLTYNNPIRVSKFD